MSNNLVVGDNVVLFPGVRKEPETAIETLRQNIAASQLTEIEEITDELSSMTLEQLGNIGIVFNSSEEPKHIKHIALFIESLRALILHYHGKPHPFHSFSEEVFDYLGEGKIKFNFDEEEAAMMAASVEEQNENPNAEE